MTNEEIRLECLKLGLGQAKVESRHMDRKAVAEIATEFYSFVIGHSEPHPEVEVGKRRGRKPGDKAPDDILG